MVYCLNMDHYVKYFNRKLKEFRNNFPYYRPIYLRLYRIDSSQICRSNLCNTLNVPFKNILIQNISMHVGGRNIKIHLKLRNCLHVSYSFRGFYISQISINWLACFKPVKKSISNTKAVSWFFSFSVQYCLCYTSVYWSRPP